MRRGRGPDKPRAAIGSARVMILAGLMVGCAFQVCSAAVLDIGPDGQVTIIDRPSVYLSADPSAARPIAQRPSISAPRDPGLNPRADGQVTSAIRAASRSVQLDSDLVEAVAWQESRLRPNAVSPKGAVGVMQLMPATARSVGADNGELSSNINGGAQYLRRLVSYYDGDLIKALSAYNAGPGAVDRHGGRPPYRETQAYVAAVLERLAQRAAPAQPPQIGKPR